MPEEVRERVIDRTGWPPGPWDNEPDRWEDRELGFPVLAVRNWHGEWCGYVGVPPGHPWHGKNYNDVPLEAHCGLTYGSLCHGSICHVPRAGEPAEVFWLGFDCGHCGDLSPASLCGVEKEIHDQVMREFGGQDYRARDVYRDLAYVQKQTRAMAAAAAAAQ